MALNAQGVTTGEGGRDRIGGIHVFHQGGRPLLGLALFLLLLTSARFGICDATPKDASDDAVVRAFEAGLGTFSEGERPLLLEVNRNGNHWSLTGHDQTGASIHRLACLLCTNEEAAAAAAYLGNTLGRAYRGETSTATTVKSSDTTLSIGGIPVPPVHVDEKQPFLKPVPEAATIRTRLAVVAAGLGLSAVVIGGVFLWMDGACADQACAQFHELKGSGIALIVSGALLETTAVLLWCLKRKPEVRK